MLDTKHPAPKPRLDPRLQQRRAAVRRQEGRRRLRVLLGAVAVSGLWAGTWAASVSPLLDVDRVAVHGAARTGPAGVRSAAGIRAHMRMVEVKADRAEAKLEALPWIRSAEVQRRWPGTVRIDVLERVPAAAVPNTAGGWALVDAEGHVLAWEPPGSLPRVEGIAPVGAPGTRLDPAGADALEAAAAASPPLLARIEAFAPSGEGGVEARLRGQGVARLGSGDQLREKLVVLETVLAQTDTSNVAAVDVSVPRSPVLTRLAEQE